MIADVIPVIATFIVTAVFLKKFKKRISGKCPKNNWSDILASYIDAMTHASPKMQISHRLVELCPKNGIVNISAVCKTH